MNNKQYIYRVYRSGVYQGVWTDVVSEFSYQQEINSSGSSVKVMLARAADDYGEGTDVDFNNKVKIYVVDDEVPNGQLIFQGYIASYRPIYGDNEAVEVLIEGYGATLDNYMIETGETVDVNQNSQNANLSMGTTRGSDYTRFLQSFTVGAGITKLSAVEFKLAAGIITMSANGIIGNSYVGNTVVCEVFESQAAAELAGSSNVLASATLPLASTDVDTYKFSFASAPTVTPGAVLYARLRVVESYTALDNQCIVYYDDTAPYSGGSARRSDSGTWSNITGDFYIKTYTSTGNTTSPYTSQDPSDILRAIIDNYNAQGGEITYTAASIDDTGISVDYTFNTNTLLEGINKILSLAPAGWYWYIDQANNVLHFHKTASAAAHQFTLTKDIADFSIEKRTQDLVNIVYFVGGPTGGTNLYLKTVLQTSIDIYGRRAIRIVDQNVTSAATAAIISNSYLTKKGQVSLRIDIEIIDNGGQSTAMLGYNLEDITLGEMVSFLGFGPQSAGSLWDVALWDIAKWDFDITDLSSLLIQVTRLDYSADKVRLSLSTTPADVNKRIDDIRRKVEELSSLNNPDAPE